MSAAALLRRNLLIYGLGGIIAPFIGIKVIDVVLTAVGLDVTPGSSRQAACATVRGAQ